METDKGGTVLILESEFWWLLTSRHCTANRLAALIWIVEDNKNLFFLSII